MPAPLRFSHSVRLLNQTPSLKLKAVAAALLLLLPLDADAPRAIDENLTKGATNHHVFESGVWGENIDLLNGGLSLTVPIGPTYHVSGDVSYQLKLSYSSKLWHIEDCSEGNSNTCWGGNEHHRARSRLQGRGQAGLGFMLQLGRYFTQANSADCAWSSPYWVPAQSKVEQWVFEDSTGAVHPAQEGTRGSIDGSLLKIDHTKVMMPDGTRYVLGDEVDDLLEDLGQAGTTAWPRCSWQHPAGANDPNAGYDIYTNDYRGRYVIKIEGKDRLVSGQALNYAVVEYEDAPGMKHLMKRITNYRNGTPDTARSITFVNSNVHPSNPAVTLPMGYVKSITLPVFGDDPSVVETGTYTFNYVVEDIYDAWVNPNNPTHPLRAQDNTTDMLAGVLLLESITFPEGYTMTFGYTGNGWDGRNVGYLQWRELPTDARIEYDYQTYSFSRMMCGPGPTGPCPPIGLCPAPASVYTCQADAEPEGSTAGVAVKRVIPDPYGNPSASYIWSYDRHTFAQNRPTPSAVVVTDPFLNDTVSYFHSDLEDGAYEMPCVAGGCSYWHYNDWWKNGLSYKTEYYRGSYLDPGNLLRTEYQKWEDDIHISDPTNPMLWAHTGNYKRVVESGTIYHDDGGKTRRTVHDPNSYDGYGNFRKSIEYGFDGLPYRIQMTDYNNVTGAPACPGLSAVHCTNWIVGTHSYSQSLDPAGVLLQRSEYFYDALGRLRTKKDVLTLPTAAGAGLAAGNPASGTEGDIRTEYKYEGDTTCPAGAASYPTGNLCEKSRTVFGATPGTFTEAYTYQSVPVGGQTHVLPFLATRKLGTMGWKAEDREVDASTGLTRVSRDTAGVRSTFDYDKLGRLVSVSPDTITDPGSTSTELPAVLSYPDIWTTRLEQAISGSDKIYSQFSFDRLGRLIQVDKRQWDGSLTTQKTQFDIAGRVTWQGEWGDPNVVTGDPTRGTTFDHTSLLPGFSTAVTDPFGRVQKTITADGKVTRYTYAGASSTTSVEGIQTDFSPSPSFITATTFFEKDAFGRLTRVLAPRTYNPSPSVCSYLASGADAYYTYDALDRLVSVRLESQTNPNNPACPTSSQHRSFTYDALGRQTTASNPENGTVVNLKFDAVGNLLQRQDAVTNVFTYEYDGAARMLKGWLDKAGPDPNRLIIENMYDQNTPATFGLGLGKLTTAKSFDDSGQEVLREELRYRGMNGRLSQVARKYGRWDSAISNILSQTEILTSYRYNRLGLLDRISYPERQGVAGFERTVLSPQLTYANGYLTAVSDPNRGILVESMSYNPAGGVGKIKTRGGVETDLVPDSRNRPASITVTKLGSPSVTHFDSGAYTYDGAGNIASIGVDKFGYDAVGRLIHGFLIDPVVAGKTETMDWSYDPLGNMTLQIRATFASGMQNSVVTTKQFNMNSKNQIQSTVQNPPPDDPNFVYDGNGNLVRDPGFEYVFDARNRLIEMHEALSGELVSRYTYDGSGYRISKYDAATQMTTFHMRDASGQTLSEFRRSNRPGTPSWFKDYVYAAGRHVAMVENDVPAAPGGLMVHDVSDPGQPPAVTLTWEANSELDISYYRLKRTCCQMWQEPPGPLNVDLWSTGYVDTDIHLEENIEYTYSIVAIDSAGLASAPSEAVVARPGDQWAPTAPNGATAVPGDARVRLSWNGPQNVNDLWGYRIYRKLELGGTYELIESMVRQPQSVYEDITVDNDANYGYQIRSVDTAGLESGPAATSMVKPTDTTPPAAPFGLYAIPGAGRIDVYWSDIDSFDVSGYEVYRSTSPISTSPSGSAHAAVVDATLPDTTSVAPNMRYYFRVRARDSAGTPNWSALSEQLEVVTPESTQTLPAPTVSSSQAQQWVWTHCRLNFDVTGIANWGGCYLPAVQLTGPCYWEDPPGPGTAPIHELECGQFTHENSRNSVFSWSPAGTEDLIGFRIYGRQNSQGAWKLKAEYPEEHLRYMRTERTGAPAPMYDHYPIAVDESASTGLYRYQDYGVDPEDQCHNMTYRVSAVATIGSNVRESVLSTDMVTVPKPVPIPENLSVGAEPIDPETCTGCNRLNPQHYGLTLSWSAGGSSCGSMLAGYHVYRSRYLPDATGYGVTPIRITREPIQEPVLRVDYLPLYGPTAEVDHYGDPNDVFDGPMGSGFYFDGERCTRQYAVRAVDHTGQMSGLSNQVFAHTDAQHPTNNQRVGYPCFAGQASIPLLNTENALGADYLSVPAPSALLPPGAVTSPSSYVSV